MVRRVRAWALAAVVVGSAGAASQTRPAADFSTPDATVRSWVAALEAMDAPRAADCFVMRTELGKGFLQALTRSVVTTERMVQAERAHFPEAEVKTLPPPPAEGMEEAYKGAKVETEGDRAWVLRAGQTREKSLTLVRVDGQWKIDGEKSFALDTDAGREAAAGLIESAGPTLDVLEAVVRDIEAGRIRNLAEARARLGARATTRAATRP